MSRKKCAWYVLGFVKTTALASRLAMVQRSGRNSNACMAERGVAEQPTFFTRLEHEVMQFIGAFFVFCSMFFPFLLSQALAKHFGCYHCCNKIPHAPGAQCLIFFILLIVFFDVFLYFCTPLLRMWFRFVCFFMFCSFCSVVLIFGCTGLVCITFTELVLA